MSAQKSQGAQVFQSPEALRKRVLEDPHSEQIAQHLGVSLTEYVDRVVHYVLHPKEQPSLYIVEDKDLRAMGLEPPDPGAMGLFVMEAASLTPNTQGHSGFVDEAEREKKQRASRN